MSHRGVDAVFCVGASTGSFVTAEPVTAEPKGACGTMSEDFSVLLPVTCTPHASVRGLDPPLP